MASYPEAIELQRGKSKLPARVDERFDTWPREDRPRVCAIAAHTLRHDGAAASEWQPWLALAAWGCAQQDGAPLARELALAARVYPEIARRLPASVPAPRRADRLALTYALGLSPAGEPPPLPDADRLKLIREGFDTLVQDDCYALIADAIAKRDWEPCREAFEQLTAFALEGYSPDEWNAETSPGYEPIPAALAAVARSKGFPLERLSAEARGWLWPAVESEDGIVPALWPPEAAGG